MTGPTPPLRIPAATPAMLATLADLAAVHQLVNVDAPYWRAFAQRIPFSTVADWFGGLQLDPTARHKAAHYIFGAHLHLRGDPDNSNRPMTADTIAERITKVSGIPTDASTVDTYLHRMGITNRQRGRRTRPRPGNGNSGAQGPQQGPALPR